MIRATAAARTRAAATTASHGRAVHHAAARVTTSCRCAETGGRLGPGCGGGVGLGGIGSSRDKGGSVVCAVEFACRGPHEFPDRCVALTVLVQAKTAVGEWLSILTGRYAGWDDDRLRCPAARLHVAAAAGSADWGSLARGLRIADLSGPRLKGSERCCHLGRGFSRW